ncbi:MAG: hypothetical protein EOP50_22430, partial [Sphingobacteriales bacterium]
MSDVRSHGRSGPIAGPVFICPDAQATYSIAPVTGALSYTWSLPSGWTGASASDSIQVTPGSGTDTIRVSANFLCGSSPFQELVVQVSEPAGITPLGSTSFCSGDSLQLLANGDTSITWQWLLNGAPIPNASDSLLTVTQSGIYSVITVRNALCTDTSDGDIIIVHPLPVPLILSNGTALTTAQYDTYQWNHNGSAITGATSQSYTVILATGSYTVTVTDSNGCTATSAPYVISSIGEMKTNEVSIYPNPAAD